MTIDKNIHVTKFEHPTGLYYEAISPLWPSFTSWDFETYLNITTYFVKLQTLSQLFQRTNDFCLLLKEKEDDTLNQVCMNFLQNNPTAHKRNSVLF